MATLTIPAKPLEETAFTLICCPAPPARSVTAAGVMVTVKSPAGAFEPPPQEINMRHKRKLEHHTRAFEKTPISHLSIGLLNLHLSGVCTQLHRNDLTPEIFRELLKK
jgi:hypothetical protein